MTGKAMIFISSVQQEFSHTRTALRDFIGGNRLLSRHFDVFLFEDLPATDRRPDELYLDRVDQCTIFVSLFGSEYGWEDPSDGQSPTEREFDQATAQRKRRYVFLKRIDANARHAKMQLLVAKASRQLKYAEFSSEADLNAAVYESLVEYLEACGIIQTRPFDATIVATATTREISTERVRWFLRIARRERNLPLPESASATDTLTHLRLCENRRVSNAGILLFGRDPQRFAPTAITKCAHFHGMHIEKPIASQQVFEGTLFEQVDGAVDFAMSRLARAVGTRQDGPSAPVRYEIPKEAIAEIVVNAVAHRDYTSNASVQVFVFADRIEVSNPGSLPSGMTPAHLTLPHASEPQNPLIARPLYLAHYIENLGTGTLDVIRWCRDYDLPAPDFEQRGNQFYVTLWRDWLASGLLSQLNLSDRQLAALPILRRQGRITNQEYQTATGVTRATAKRDLEDLIAKGLVELAGSGRGAHYLFVKKRPAIDSTTLAENDSAPPMRIAAHVPAESPVPTPTPTKSPTPVPSTSSLAANRRTARQEQAMQVISHEGRITNREYQQLTGVSRPTAQRDLDDMARRGLIELIGSGRAAHYRPTKAASNDSSNARENNGSEMAQMVHESNRASRKTSPSKRR